MTNRNRITKLEDRILEMARVENFSHTTALGDGSRVWDEWAAYRFGQWCALRDCLCEFTWDK